MDDTKDLSDNVNEPVPEDENKSAISADLIRGHINTIILRTLYERDKYGYEIIEEIEKKSHGQYSLKQPTLYSALKRLESQGYINAYWKTDEVSLGGRRKYYTLTDSGREITEKNQAEWEYSRTVIDNLISDRSFDFSQPAPTSVDFKILKKSTSRVPVVKDSDDDDEDENDDEEIIEEKTESIKKEEKSEKLSEVQVNPDTVTYTEQIIYYETVLPSPAHVNQSLQQTASNETQQQPEPLTVNQVQQTEPATVNQTQQQQTVSSVREEQIVQEERRTFEEPPMNEEQKRIVHENYLRLISEPIPEPPKEVDVVPVADDIDTDKLMYNNKPETERDYRNLINNLFSRTVKRKPQQNEEVIVEKREEPVQAATTVRLEDVNAKADNDGLKVDTSDYVITSNKKSYNKGATLFKSSLIISVILLLEFILTIIFRKNLGANGVSLAYPFVILSIAVAQLLIFGVLCYADIGKFSRKPSPSVYLSASIIITVILIFIIFIVSILLNINFTSTGDIFGKIIIPCLVALNIPAFAVCFYAFTKNS